MTLKEIAREAGVSVSTVSRVINNNSKAASREVQDRIWEIVRRTGYIPNSAAQNLKMGSRFQDRAVSRSLACLFARTPDMMTDLFFNSLARSIEQEAFQHNYILKYSFSAFDIHAPSTYRLVVDNHVNGIAVLGRCDKQTLKFLKQYFNSVVYAGLNSLDANYDQVICSGRQAGYAAAEHLINLGHSRIAYIGETISEERYLGYCDALAAHDIPLRPEYIVNVKLSSEDGFRGAQIVIERNTDVSAIFCSNDLTAIGAMRALQTNGIHIPKDISLISIDDIDTVQYLSPMLTTVHVPTQEMGQMAAKILIDRIEGGHRLPVKISLPFYLANRESCTSYRRPGRLQKRSE